MNAADSISHASLNGLYVKARELDRGHAAPPAFSAAPPGLSADEMPAGPDTGTAHATSSATAHASPADASNAASKHAQATADYSLDYAVSYRDDDASCSIEFRCFDTPNRIKVFRQGLEDDACEQALLHGRRLCLELHRLWSFSLEASDISRINERCTGADIDPKTAWLIEQMDAFSAYEPLYDYTIGRVSYLWKKARRVLRDSKLAAIREHTGRDKLHLAGTRVLKDDPLLQIDVGGSAKGAAADLVAAALQADGVKNAIIDLGGNLLFVGAHPSGRSFRASVFVPEGMVCTPPTLEVAEGSVVTSGSYERFVEIDGTRYQHIIDPRTGRPAQSDIVSATVVAASSLAADLLATTALIAGSEGFEALAARHVDCRFVAILEDGSVLDTKNRAS